MWYIRYDLAYQLQSHRRSSQTQTTCHSPPFLRKLSSPTCWSAGHNAVIKAATTLTVVPLPVSATVSNKAELQTNLRALLVTVLTELPDGGPHATHSSLPPFCLSTNASCSMDSRACKEEELFLLLLEGKTSTQEYKGGCSNNYWSAAIWCTCARNCRASSTSSVT